MISDPARGSMVPVTALAVAALISCAPTIRSTLTQPITPSQLAQLWIEPDLGSRDLYYGIGGRRYVPDPGERYELKGVDNAGFSRGYDVVDGQGREWDVKLGPESRTEVVASRIIWAVGYHQPPMYFVSRWRINRKDGYSLEARARFRPKLPELESVGTWSFHQNPLVGTRPLRGLIALNALIGNSDLKPQNNATYEVREPLPVPGRWFVVKDTGHSFGRTGKLYGTRDDLEGFRKHGFIKGVANGHVEFEWHGRHGELLKDITPDDVRWICGLLTRITPAQWGDAFRAGGYEPDEARPFIDELQRRIQQGIALGN